jgi:polysaccharide biosynthesis/export protein
MTIRSIAPIASTFLLVAAVAAAQTAPATTTQKPGTTGAASLATGTSGKTAPEVARGAAVSSDYRLVAGDKLRIEVYKDPQLSQSLQIRPDGKITLPLVGDVAAAGRTSNDLRDSIATSLKDYISNPVVTVIVVETVPDTVFVMGEVNAAGTIPLKGQLSIVQALAMAGGFKDFAHRNDIQVLRKTATGTTTLHFNYNDAMKGRAPLLVLQPGDTVIVK